MDIRMALDGAAALALVAMPWLALLLVAWRSARPEPIAASGVNAEARHIAEPLGIMTTPPPHGTATDAAAERDTAEASVAQAAILTALSHQEQEVALAMAVESAMTARDDVLLSRHSVQLARLLLARSARSQAATLLQSAALAARRAKLPSVHAEARLELAEMAFIDGDLTTACEHWQMAKVMFHEMGQRGDESRVADVMRRHHCPTDWVLTNF
jgi:hypothetical protein